MERLSLRWEQRAAELGFGSQEITALVDRPRPERRVNLAALARRLLGPEGLTAHASTFDRRDVLQAICQQLPTAGPQSKSESLLTPSSTSRPRG